MAFELETDVSWYKKWHEMAFELETDVRDADAV